MDLYSRPEANSGTAGYFCGWAPNGVRAYSAWMALARRVDWDLLALFLFADLLILPGVVVARASGLLRWPAAPVIRPPGSLISS